jgi:hypothetical protein
MKKLPYELDPVRQIQLYRQMEIVTNILYNQNQHIINLKRNDTMLMN